jgi:uncharacterized protein
MPTYLTPGVYVEEVPSGARPIQSKSTSTPVFVGTGGRADAPIGVPTAITNWSQFVNQFMGEGPMTPLAHAVNGFFMNTLGRCYILDVGPDGTLAGSPQRPGLSILEEIEEIAIVCAPGYTTPSDYDVLTSHCETMRDRVAILDCPREVDDIMSLTRVATMEATDTSAERPAEGAEPSQPQRGGRQEQENNAPRPSPFATLYAPWVLVKDLTNGETVLAPPSGHMAGIWARTDSTRGVHKAPANEPMRGVVGVQRRVTASEQGELNSAGVNVIRLFDRIGIRPWGARTLARDSAPEWTYINVRRLFSMAEESIAQGTNWIVFEPNDRPLWNMIVRDISAFLTGLWRDGALMGRTAEEAFFVKCDEETNPPDSIDAGRVVVWIGMAPVKPAEFIVFQVSQFSGGTITEEVSSRV